MRIIRGVYGEGAEPASELDLARAAVLATNGVAGGLLAGVIHGLDAVALTEATEAIVRPGRSAKRTGVRRRLLDPARVIDVAGVPTTDGLQTMVHLASCLDDLAWEQALESALRKRLFDLADLENMLPVLGLSRTPGIDRMRRVLASRPPGAPPTGSLLETLAIQLVRGLLEVPDPERQVVILNEHGDFVATVDLAWPHLGLFLELDGQGHKDQPLYDARRETAVVAATGWLCGRFTWYEVVYLPRSTARRILALIEQAIARPIAG